MPRSPKTRYLNLPHISKAVLDGPGRSRTCDLGIKSPLLYQLSYRPVALGWHARAEATTDPRVL